MRAVFALVLVSCGYADPRTGIDPADSGVPDGDLLPEHKPTAIAVDGITGFLLPNNEFTKIPYSIETYDDGNELSASTFVPVRTGEYHVCAAISVSQSTVLELAAFVNGARLATLDRKPGMVEGCRGIALAAGDVLDVRVLQSSGAAIALASAPATTWLTIHEQPTSIEVLATTFTFVATGDFAKVPFAQELRDTGDEFDPAANAIVAKEAGVYQLCASLSIPNAPTTTFELALFKNDLRNRSFGIGQGSTSGCTSVVLAKNDRVDVRTIPFFSSGNFTVPSDAVANWLTARRLTSSLEVDETITFAATAGLFAPVKFSTEVQDPENAFDPATSRYSVPAAGDYEVCASLAVVDGIELELAVFVNDVRGTTLLESEGQVQGCRVLRLASGDVVDLRLAAESTMSIQPAGGWNWLSIHAMR